MVSAGMRRRQRLVCGSAMRGYRSVKFTLFTFCYCFWVVSAVLTAVGVYAKMAKEKDVVDTLALDPALLLMVVGCGTFLLSFLGCLGALRNAACLLKTFLGLLAAVVVLQLAAGVLAHLFTDSVMERTEKLMMKTVVRYRDDRDLENAIDFVQKKVGADGQFQCCGVEGYRDWSRNIYFLCSDTNPSVEACGVPFSCCRRRQNQTVLNTMCGYGMQRLDAGVYDGPGRGPGLLHLQGWWTEAERSAAQGGAAQEGRLASCFT
ncbi:unnamed protein product [Tetraodon nigroviridis]|uniref:Tetraspanin-33 n=1 Tax=Tetraodon nigroviridis TaxID=99883 RepID=Q4TAA1_TETNG|nr:unnamed protein product [Tetraodon nigroviridis]